VKVRQVPLQGFRQLPLLEELVVLADVLSELLDLFRELPLAVLLAGKLKQLLRVCRLNEGVHVFQILQVRIAKLLRTVRQTKRTHSTSSKRTDSRGLGELRLLP